MEEIKNENNIENVNENVSMSDEYSYEDRLQIPYLEKKKGDQFLTENKIEESIKHFCKAIMSVKILNDDKALNTDQLNTLVNEVGIPSNLNLSYCYMKLKYWKGVVLNTTRVIEFNKKHVKALYRRCLALINLNDFVKADLDLVELEELIGGSKELEELETLYENKQKGVKENENLVYKKMFKKYIKTQEEKKDEEIITSFHNVAQKTPGAIGKIYEIVKSSVQRPFDFIMQLPKNLKYYFFDAPLNFCRRKKQMTENIKTE